MTKSKNVLEIGSYRYKTTNQIAKAIQENYRLDANCNVVTFDVIKGGYDGGKTHNISSPILYPNFWFPYKTDDSNELDKSKFVLDNSEFSNEEIVNLNKNILKDICQKLNIEYFDLIFIDGDHSTKGIQNDFDVISEFANKDTLIVIDNIWDIRLIEVKNFFDKQKYIKWNFKEFNDKYYIKNRVQDTGVLVLEELQ